MSFSSRGVFFLAALVSITGALGMGCSMAAEDDPPSEPDGAELDDDSPEAVTACAAYDRSFDKDIFIHTLYDTHVGRRDFGEYRRWYQESGNTQTFKLYAGDVNHATSRPGHPRIEAYTPTWRSHGEWHEFSATYQAEKIGGAAIMQLKSPDGDVDWEVMINMESDGTVRYNARREKDLVLGRNMVGKPFHLRVRSNGKRYQVYYNCRLVADTEHQMDSSGNQSYAWRWGLYTGTASKDSVLRVTGARTTP